MAIPYDEIRWWAVWLQMFTASDLADSMGTGIAVGERGVLALLHQGICEDTGDVLPGPDGPERVIRYKPIPKGPRVRPRELPPEVVEPRRAGGDPLRVPRGMPVAMSDARRRSRVGNWHPGRRGSSNNTGP